MTTSSEKQVADDESSPSLGEIYLPSPLEFAIQNCGRKKTLEAINSLPGTDPEIKNLILEIWDGRSGEIQQMYTNISQSPQAEVSALISSTLLLKSLFKISFERQSAVVVEKLLAVSPSPTPDMKSFLNSEEGLGPMCLWACESPEIWTVMLKHGYMNADQDGSQLELPLGHMLLLQVPRVSEVASVLLNHGAKPELWHLETAIRNSDFNSMNLLLNHIPREKLNDCRILHDAIQFRRINAVRWLLDVAKMDINLIPSQRPRVFLEEFPQPGAKAESNGTPLHEAVLHNEVRIANLLLERGAKTDILNEDGETLLQVARRRGHWLLVALLMVNWN